MAHLFSKKQPRESKRRCPVLLEDNMITEVLNTIMTYLSLAKRTDIPTSLANSSAVREPFSDTYQKPNTQINKLWHYKKSKVLSAIESGQALWSDKLVANPLRRELFVCFFKSTTNYKYFPLKTSLLYPGKTAKYKKASENRVTSVKKSYGTLSFGFFLKDALELNELKN